MNKIIFNLILMLIAVCAFSQAPDWQWAIQAGGISYDHGFGIAVDSIGNSYITGF